VGSARNQFTGPGFFQFDRPERINGTRVPPRTIQLGAKLYF
jgi:hypothetical protein